MPLSAEERRTRAGFAAAIATYLVWGVSPLFFRSVSEVPALEVVAHRVVWGLLAVVVILAVRGDIWKTLLVLRDRRTFLITAAAAVGVSVNWVTFVFAVVNGYALQASLGYFLLPLVSVVLGVFFLSERLTRRQLLALVLVLAGVAALMIGLGVFPWVALVLAFSFSFYGLLRKISPSESLAGLFNETLLLMPLALGYLVWLEIDGTGAFGQPGNWDTRLLLMIGTPIWTAFPLFLFAFAARRMKLSTLGLMFYANPTIQFFIAVFILNEAFTLPHAISFGLIWTGLAVYLWPARRKVVAPPQ